MRTPTALIPLVATVLLWVAISSDGTAQGPYWPQRWSHAYVHSDGNDVYVTYVEGNGCRDQKIELTGPRVFNLEATEVHALATASAISRLGYGGYEMVAEGHAYCHTSNRSAVHFKRGGF